MGGGVEEFQVATDDGDGGAELVAGVVDELSLRLIGSVNSIKHSVESTSQVGDFVFAVDRDAGGEVRVGDLVGDIAQGPNGVNNLVSDEPGDNHGDKHDHQP